MDLRKLKTLIDLVSESNISELEITEAEGKVKIVKAGVASALQMLPAAAPLAVAAPSAGAPASAADSPSPAAPEQEQGFVVKAPMVGTLYCAASPGAAPFVKVGSQVKEGDTLCIIEAMKILNEIESEKAGTVVKILGENGQAVEYGQPLFVIE